MDIIQFHCPACRTLLRVPPAAAGFQGPCPSCQREIIGPIPAKGLEARLAPADAFTPFPGSPVPSPPEAPTPQEAPPEPQIPTTPEPEPTSEPAPAPEPIPEPEPTPEPIPDPEPVQPPAPEPDPFSPFSDSPRDLQPPASRPAEKPEPAPEPEPRASKEGPIECLAPKHVRRLRTAVLILSCLLCSVISYIFGYVMAQKSRSFAAPIFTDPSALLAVPPLPEPTPDEEPAPTIPTTIEDPDNAVEESTDEPDIDLSGTPDSPASSPAARATLDAFLSAPDWASRSAYVISPDKVRSDMKAHAEAHKDGPIETTSIESAYTFTDQEHFIVRTKEIPNGFPVTLQLMDSDWRIDWKVFQEFHTDAFRKFASGKLDETGEFHLYLRPHAEQDANGFTRYQLTAPIEGRSYPAFGKRGKMAQAKITALLDSEEFRDNPEIQELLKKDGIPLVLKLSYQSRGNDQNFLLIEDLVAQGWGH